MEDTSKDSKDEWLLHICLLLQIRTEEEREKLKSRLHSFIGIFFILSSQSDCLVTKGNGKIWGLNSKTNLQQGMTLELRQAFLSCFKNVTYSLMGLPKQSLLYNSCLNVKTCEIIHHFFCPFRNWSEGWSCDCLCVGLICQAKCICCYVHKTHSLLMLPDDLVMDWTYNTVPRTLCRCYLSKQPVVLSLSLCLLFSLTFLLPLLLLDFPSLPHHTEI